ncbi:MAG: acyl carrier protein [Sodaliphilus sp.]
MENKILTIMREVLDDANVHLGTTSENCENWDSLHHLMLMSELEEAFGMDFTPEQMATMKDFQTIKGMLEK